MGGDQGCRSMERAWNLKSTGSDRLMDPDPPSVTKGCGLGVRAVTLGEGECHESILFFFVATLSFQEILVRLAQLLSSSTAAIDVEAMATALTSSSLALMFCDECLSDHVIISRRPPEVGQRCCVVACVSILEEAHDRIIVDVYFKVCNSNALVFTTLHAECDIFSTLEQYARKS